MKDHDHDPSNARALKRILDDLPLRQRDALMRFYIEGRSAQQICRDLGLDEAEFRKIKARVRDALRRPKPPR